MQTACNPDIEALGYSVVEGSVEIHGIDMSDFLTYKGYLGSVEYSAEDNCLFGKVMYIKSLLAYEGNSLQELEEMFHQTIDEYLEECKASGTKHNKPCSGTLNLRLGSARHICVAEQASKLGISINELICSAIDKQIDSLEAR